MTTAAPLPANLIHLPLWIVTMPRPLSVVEDICFSCTVPKLGPQFLGGLESDQIIGVYTDETTARTLAAALLESRDKTLAIASEAAAR